MRGRRFTLEGKIMMICFSGIVTTAGCSTLVFLGSDDILLSVLSGIFTGFIITLFFLHRVMGSVRHTIEALHFGVKSLQDADFSIQLVRKADDEIGDLLTLFNQFTETLLHERKDLFQRELLLDTILQQSPSAIILLNDENRIAFANRAARVQFWEGKKMEGYHLSDISKSLPEPIQQFFSSPGSSFISLKMGQHNETFQVYQKTFLLNMKTNTLIMFSRLTKEFAQQEVQIWKKAIRLMNHELNNSLAPISSLVHSAKLLTQKNEPNPNLIKIFASLEKNIENLTRFLAGYSKFARLPHPMKQEVQWSSFLARLNEIMPFNYPSTSLVSWFDPVQMQQVLVNLIKNAQESGSPAEAINLELHSSGPASLVITVTDQGRGMDADTMRQALLPFFSTKENGTGLGLPLCKEIIEMHGGSLTLKARENGGLRVQIVVPVSP
ncbi:PAS domain-containing sensor histidine kinase [candidate division CSSED10-310 bacterium]|uniref:histidine kinase n=1 Tax=candidate division CSSED10-310 bacterium TaxID=2855610 RepID=A0ABV6YZF7_UNCC1